MKKSILERACELPIKTFMRISSNGGLMLLSVAILALIWANSPWQDLYTWFFEKFHVKLSVNDFAIDMHMLHWINDGLMTIFFFMVGMEIKREMLAGELSDIKVATLPIFGAVGGMVVPVIIYKLFGMEGEAANGWGIPMATDIAFSIGILSLLGNRVSLSLKVFLTALAIVDDLGAVLVIAIFYTSEIAWMYLLIGLGLFLFLLILNRCGVSMPMIYVAVGIVIWWFFLQSGIHATISGVLVAFTIPMRNRIDTVAFAEGVSANLPSLQNLKYGHRNTVVLTDEQMHAIDKIGALSTNMVSPLQYMEHSLQRFVNYVVLPLFALSNSGIILYSFSGAQHGLVSLVTFAIAVSLFLGKTIGIASFSWLAVKLKLADKPAGSSWHTMIGMGMMGGIGFTMSLFIATLAFKDPNILAQAKLGIFIGSIFSGVVGYYYLKSSVAADEKANAAAKGSNE